MKKIKPSSNLRINQISASLDKEAWAPTEHEIRRAINEIKGEVMFKYLSPETLYAMNEIHIIFSQTKYSIFITLFSFKLRKMIHT